jgi:hypothetical protein
VNGGRHALVTFACALAGLTCVHTAHADDEPLPGDPGDIPPALPEHDPPPGLPRDPYAGLAPLDDDPFDRSPPRESTAWIFVSVALGGGSSRLGPIATEAAADAHLFVLSKLSLGARFGAVGFGEPDGNGASGRYVSGLVGYRTRLAGNELRTKGAPVTWLHVMGGAGWMGLKGYDKDRGQRLDFALDRVVFVGRAAVIWARGVFGTSIGLDVLGVPSEGLAIMPTLTFGFMF